MKANADTIVWISGATEGLGKGLAAAVPYENARIINLSRRQHPTLETIKFDLTEPESWDAVGDHFKETLANFTGKRAIFVHNAFYRGQRGWSIRPSIAKKSSPTAWRQWCWATCSCAR
jgi:benzil reductase ((S)-benzoin forming)